MRGGKRAGAGRPRKDKSDMRPSHHVRAYPFEWQVIKQIIDLVRKKDYDAIKRFIDTL